MRCRGINTNHVGVIVGTCSQECADSSRFCPEHQKVSRDDYKSLWIRMFILGADGKPFQYRYNEKKKDRILRDLGERTVELTDVDISNIPSISRFMDIYMLLLEYGYSEAKTNFGLYFECCRYLSQFMFPMNTSLLVPYSTLARKIVEVLILRNEEHLQNFLNEFIRLLKFCPEFQGEYLTKRILSVTAFLSSLLDSDAARKMSWQHENRSLADIFAANLGHTHPITSYVKEVLVHEFYDLYQLEKQRQKQMLDALKEELMAMTWHPDRFQEWCLDEEEKAENRMLFG